MGAAELSFVRLELSVDGCMAEPAQCTLSNIISARSRGK